MPLAPGRPDPGRRRGHEALGLPDCGNSCNGRLHAARSSQYGSLSIGRYVRIVQPADEQGGTDHPLRAVAAAVVGLDSSREDRYGELLGKETFDDRPSTTNQQKRAFASRVEAFVDQATPAPYTDISGGLLQAIEFLNEKRTARKEILIFSDMKEDLAKGYVRDIPLDFKGFDVVALNVTKLRTDNFDPRQYLDRLEEWRVKVEKGGGHWRVINDLDRLDGLL
jgi:hypothetical protein